MSGRYPLVDSRGFTVGTVTVNDDVIPEAIAAGVEFILGGQWIAGREYEFLQFVIVPMEDRKPRQY